MNQSRNDFRPDYNQESAGVYLEWILETRGIKQVELAKRCGRPTKTISEIISGKAAITPETALQLERVLGVNANLWVRLDSQYQLQKARHRDSEDSSDIKSRKWAKSFPIGEMQRLGFITAPQDQEHLVDSLLRYFKVSNVSAWTKFWNDRVDLARLKQTKHHSIDRYAVIAWLNQGERIAASIETSKFDEAKFRNALQNLRQLTREPWRDCETQIINVCRQAGVAVVLVPHLSKTGIRGAAYWATKDKAVIILSDRNKSQASVWFAFFHESAHILLHSKKTVFIDHEKDGSAEEQIEKEADSFSAELLIPEPLLKEAISRTSGNLTAAWIEETSSWMGVGADLLLARLQHENLLKHNSRLTKKFRRELTFKKCTPF